MQQVRHLAHAHYEKPLTDLLQNSPPAWCRTVSSFYNWRVVKVCFLAYNP